MSSTSTVIPAIPTSDLRSESKAYQRTKNQVTKWSHGGRVAPGKSCSHDLSLTGASCNECVARPQTNQRAHYFARAARADIHSQSTAHRQGNIAKKVLQNDLHEVTALQSDVGSSDEEMIVSGVGESSVPMETEIMYSFDARSGPTTGSDVLSTAIVQAVKRFENKQTEQLVKKEYDLVLDGKDVEDFFYAGDAEDDFELIEHGEFH